MKRGEEHEISAAGVSKKHTPPTPSPETGLNFKVTFPSADSAQAHADCCMALQSAL